MITLKEACEAMLAGKKVMDDEGDIWTFKAGEGFGFYGTTRFIYCDCNETTFTKIIEPKVKYSVDIWFKGTPIKGGNESLDKCLFGRDLISWGSVPYGDFKKYKITVEEVEE